MKRALPVLLLAAACGNSPSHSQPDAGGSGTPTPITITSFTPADGATKVSPYTKVTIALSGDADAASITADTVKVTYGDSPLPVIGAVSYNATAHAITFTPSAPLRTAGGAFITPTAVKVDVKGVTAGGTAIAEGTARFATLGNPQTKLTFSGDGKTFDSVADFTHGDDGRLTVETYHSAGTDGILGTADDGVDSLRTWTNTAGHQTMLHFNDPGADGKWNTADDVIDDRVEISFNAVGNWSQWVDYQDPGADGKWMTADDVVASYSAFTFDSLGRPTQQIDSDAGADNVIGNADDNTQDYVVNTYDGNNILATTSVTYNDPGADKKWMTADDVVSEATTNTIDARGLVTKTADSVPGPDGKVGTADDQTTEVDFSTYNAHGDLIQTETSLDAGADKTFGTADDTNGSTFLWTYDDNGAALTSKVVNSGTDKTYGTADDFTSNSTVYDPSL